MGEVATVQPPSLLAKMASRFSVEPAKMLTTLKSTAFKGDVSNEQMMALLIVADQYGLNPWTKEVYAFPDKNNGIVPVVGVDGWARIINSHEQFDGMQFEQDAESCTCTIYRKDRAHPVAVTEYMAECKRGTGPWSSHPRRMLRHKAMIQCARLAFGYAGIYDQDEAERIVERDITAQGEVLPMEQHASRTEAVKEKLRGKKPASYEADPQDDALRAVEQRAPAITYAAVADKLNKAEDTDLLDAAADLIGEIADEDQRAELTAIYQARKEALQQ
jgi:phage recombination protein Bet